MALKYFEWEEGTGHLAETWDDVGWFDWDMVWTKYQFTEEAAGYTWNEARAINLIITRINYLEGLIAELGAPEITWKAICEAWLKNDFEGRAETIAIIDRMRQIIWDEPFNIQWAARPTVPD